MAIKFPTPNGIATLRGDQQIARECYRIALQKAGGEGSSSDRSDAPEHPKPPPKVLLINTEHRRQVRALDRRPPLLGGKSEIITLINTTRQVRIGRLLPDLIKHELITLLCEFSEWHFSTYSNS